MGWREPALGRAGRRSRRGVITARQREMGRDQLDVLDPPTKSATHVPTRSKHEPQKR